MNCYWRGCSVPHGSVKEMITFHEERGEVKSPIGCALDYHFEPPRFDGRRYGSMKPSLDYYDRRRK